VSVSIFHIGLHLDHPTIPPEERPKIAKRLSELKEMMRSAGYNYEIVYASPESGLEDFRHQLKTQPCDGVLIGGGVVGNPDLSYFLEQIIDATHEAAPKAKILFHNHSVDVRTTVERWFKARSV
jgi:tRNA-dihydrouridine synthase